MKTICSNCNAENEMSSKYCSTCGYILPINESKNFSEKEEKNSGKKTERKFNTKSFLGFAISFIVMFFITQYFLKPSIDKQLSEAASEMNKNCPMNVDEYTILQQVIALPNNTFQYNYTLIGITKAEIKLDTVKKYIFPPILLNVKNNPQMKSFRDNNITLQYNYSDKNGEFVTQYVVTPEMYK